MSHIIYRISYIEGIVFKYDLIETVLAEMVLSIISALVALVVCDDNGERQYFIELLSFNFLPLRKNEKGAHTHASISFQ